MPGATPWFVRAAAGCAARNAVPPPPTRGGARAVSAISRACSSAPSRSGYAGASTERSENCGPTRAQKQEGDDMNIRFNRLLVGGIIAAAAALSGTQVAQAAQ